MAGQATCPACPDGTYQTTSGQQSCVNYTVCGNGYIEGTPGTATTDRSCVPSEWEDVFDSGLTNTMFPADDQVYGSDLDSEGNLVVAGEVCGTLPGQTSVGACDSFIRKYDAGGTVLWTRQFGSTGQDGARGVSVDSNDNIIVTGFTDTGFGSASAIGGYDGYLAFFDSNGIAVWTRIFGTTSNDESLGVDVGSNGLITAVGYTEGTLPGATSVGGADYMMVQYDSNGNLVWVKQAGSNSYDEARSVSTGASGNLAILGVTTGSIMAAVGGDTLGGDDGYLHVLESDGDFLWARQFGSDNGDSARAVAFDPNGDLYVVGETYGTFVPGENLDEQDGFARKYSSIGAIIWSRQFGTALADNVWSICGTDATGFSYGGRIGTNNSAPGYEATAGRINASGVVQWDIVTQSVAFGQFGDAARACSANTDDAVYISGYTKLPYGGLDARDVYVSRVVQPTP